MGVVAELISLTLDAVFPRFCVSCRGEGAVLCTSCDSKWKTKAFLSEKGIALGKYDDEILDRLIHLWKYEFDETARDRIFERIDREILRIHAFALDVDGVVFVPLHRKRFCERGFDQAEEIAVHVGKRLKLPVLSIVSRTRATVRQALLSEEERKAQMRDNPFRITGDVNQKALLLVDDVVTTGATTDAVAELLLNAGAQRIQKFALAIT